MNANFTKMVQVKSYQHIVEQIQSAICEGTLEKGDKLPSEMKLKDVFSTSRGTVREALRVLEQKGLVSIRTGVKGGATVKDVNTEAMSDNMGLLIRHQKVSLQHLAELREFLEGYAAEKAARLNDAAAIVTLKSIIREIGEHVKTEPDGLEEFNRLDAKFHRQIATMADNPLIEANLRTIHENIHVYFQSYILFSRKVLEDDFQDLCDIAAAVEEGDSAAAGAAARQHVAKFSKLMEMKHSSDFAVPKKQSTI